MNRNTMLRIGATFGGLSVAAGAFGAHALDGRLEPRGLEVFEIAVRYQMYHALALIGCAALARHVRHASLVAHGFVWGSVVFCGSLYALAFSGARWLGAVTPVGGVLFLVGWVALAVSTDLTAGPEHGASRGAHPSG